MRVPWVPAAPRAAPRVDGEEQDVIVAARAPIALAAAGHVPGPPIPSGLPVYSAGNGTDHAG